MSEQASQATIGTVEVPVVEVDVVEQILLLRKLGYGHKRIARELQLSKNTVKRYWRGAPPGLQRRPTARTLTDHERARAIDLWRTLADGNAAVVRQLLADEGVVVPLRTLQRCLQPLRQDERARDSATVRFETPPGQQVQIDFGERKVRIGSAEHTVYFFVATLGYSRRSFVRASLSQRQDEWKLGLESALSHFGGRPEVVVVDNAKALILEHGRDHVRVHPAFEAYCKDRGLAVWACRPYRARTKGKVESGVKYVKRNAIARRVFDSFGQLEQHLIRWMGQADQRIHGTTHERPIDRFDGQERAALRPLHDPKLQVTTQRLRRQVANDCYVDVDTVRYSVPHRLARTQVDVDQTPSEVVIWHQSREVARHRRCSDRHVRVTDPAHFHGLMRPVDADPPAQSGALGQYGRQLADYAAVIGGAP